MLIFLTILALTAFLGWFLARYETTISYLAVIIFPILCLYFYETMWKIYYPERHPQDAPMELVAYIIVTIPAALLGAIVIFFYKRTKERQKNFKLDKS